MLENHIILLFIIIQNIFSINTIYLPSVNCPISCLCDFSSGVLTISSCTQSQKTFLLPSDFTMNPELGSVTSIIAHNCSIESFPMNICKYTLLTFLDLSYNQIKYLTIENFNCLNSLELLDISFNSISFITNDAFKTLTSLRSLYLSNNKISNIPKYLFYKHLKNLLVVDLSKNLLTEMELWPLYLTNILTVDLTYNSISKFTNNHEWFLDIESNNISIPSSAVVDLQYNSITLFDDRTIQQYGVCSYGDYIKFLNKFLNIFWLNNNPILCNCASSGKLVTDSINIINNGILSNDTFLYNSFCSSSYAGKSILTFDNCKSSNDYLYCKNATPLFDCEKCAHGTFDNDNKKCRCKSGWFGDSCDQSILTVTLAVAIPIIVIAVIEIVVFVIFRFRTSKQNNQINRKTNDYIHHEENNNNKNGNQNIRMSHIYANIDNNNEK